MIDKICENLTNKIQKKMPEINDERAQIIKYGLQLMIGEIPKFILLIAISIKSFNFSNGTFQFDNICFFKGL